MMDNSKGQAEPAGISTAETTRPKADHRKIVQVVHKVRAVLDAFSPERPELTFREIREATQLPSTTCFRLLTSLVNEGVLERTGGRYRPGVRLLYWGAAASRGLALQREARPFLQTLRDVTGESACLFVRDGAIRTCIALEESRHSVIRLLYVGQVMPLHAGSAGRVILAFDDEAREQVLAGDLPAFTPYTITDRQILRDEVERVRRQGYAVTREERDVGAASISAPVFGSGGKFLAALGIAGPLVRFTPDAVAAWIPEVVAAARKLSARMGFRGARDGHDGEAGGDFPGSVE